MRSEGLNVAAAVWLCFAALQAPFAHYHPEEPDHDHATGLAHLHLGHLEELHQDAEGPELDHGDYDKPAISQEWTPVAAQRIAMVYGEVTVASAAEIRFATVGVATDFVVRSHDPPNRFASHARAPPV
jgi:hypothetical protein